MKGRTLLNNRKLRVTTLVATGAATAAAGLVGTSSPAQASSVWDRLAQCESGGNWSINTGNGYYGGVQFSLQTWRGYGGQGMPHHASKAEQIRIAQRVLAGQGPGAWPVCSVRAGLTRGNGGATSSAPQQQQPQQQAPSRSKQRQAPQQQAQPQQQAPKRQVQRQAPQQQAQPQQQAPKRTYAQAPKVKAGSETITVAKGDTLAKLAKKHGVTDWRTLWGANSNKVTNPDLILVGQTLHLPA
jgi:resuscitation-promoting factor RpfA